MINFRNIFENVTKVFIKDFAIKENLVMVVVNQGDIGRAIGKSGANIKLLERKLNKKIKIIEFNDNIETFIKNIASPVSIDNIVNEDGIIKLSIKGLKERGQIIGRDRKNLEDFKKLVSKYFTIKDIKIM